MFNKLKKFFFKNKNKDDTEPFLKRCNICHEYDIPICKTKCCDKYYHRKCYEYIYRIYNMKPCCI